MAEKVISQALLHPLLKGVKQYVDTKDTDYNSKIGWYKS